MDSTRHPYQTRGAARVSAGLKTGLAASVAAALILAAGLHGGAYLAACQSATTWEALATFGDDVEVVDAGLSRDDCAARIVARVANACRPELSRAP